ncbi:MAG: hypothetical protein U1E73_10040 [Planctomycetota bacterium]
MRPLQEIPPEFFATDERLEPRMPLLDEWLERRSRLGGASPRPLEGVTALLIQHQLHNQIPMLEALFELGLAPERTWWLDIPYTSHAEVRQHAIARDVPIRQMVVSDLRVLQPYAPYQLRRTVDVLLAIAATRPERLLVLDDGAYVLEALANLHPDRWPTRRIAIVEQTTRGIIKLEHGPALQQLVEKIPVIDVARSVPKQTLEPPFIALAICAALHTELKHHFGEAGGAALRGGRCLVNGYGAIGEQVATYLRACFGLPRDTVHVHDPGPRAELARRRNYPDFDRKCFATKFRLVVGCSGQASFRLGDHVFLEDGALLASASSGTVELSRRDYVELADATPHDDVEILRDGLDENDLHSSVRVQIVDRTVTFANAGFPVNFTRRPFSVPAAYIQATAVMMVAGAEQAMRALDGSARRRIEFNAGDSDWLATATRRHLGDRASWLEPPPDESW